MTRRLFFFLAFASLAAAQWSAPPTSGYTTLNTFLSSLGAARTGAGAPGGSCTAAKDLYVNTSTSPGTLYYCDATNNWTAVAKSNASTTVNGQSCALGSTCTVTANLPANPSACPAGQFSSDIAADGTLTCSAPAKTYNFLGTTQAGVNAWNVNYWTLTNGTYTTTDATHLRSVLTVTANTTLLGNDPTNALGPWTVTPVVTTNPSVHFVAEVRATDAVNPGSMALSYACVAAAASVDSPTPVALTAITLATIATTKSIYESTQSVTCAGTPDAPADLYVWWTPTAPSGGTLTNLRWTLVY